MTIVFALQADFLWSLLKSLGVIFLVGFLFYIYYAVSLMVIAQQTATRGSGLAWIPIGNLFLMARIGRRPAWWALMCFIPLVNLIFLAMLWMSISETRGKSPWIGSLAVLPVIGLFIPAYLAISGQTHPAVTIASRNCHACGVPIVGSEVYCRNCGESAPTAVLSERMSAGMMALIGTGTSFATIVLFGVFFGVIFFRALSYEPPERKAPEMPERTAGTMTEFPVDTGDADAQTEPDSIVVEDIQGGGAGKEQTGTSKDETVKKTPPERLPPGVNRETIGKRTTTATSVVYRRKKKPSQQTAPDNVVIYVTVIRVAPGQSKVGDEIAVDVTRATSGNRTGVNVRSPRGGTYTGSRINTSQITVYVLEKQNSDIVILVYSPTSAGQETAARLASNVGNGEGLNDYPSTRSTVWVLPQRTPGALTLVSLETQTREEMGLSQRDLNDASNNEETRKWLDYISQFIPERATHARYVDNSGRRWEVMVYDYESTRRAWNTWWFVSLWANASDAKSVTVKDDDGLYIDTDEGRVLIFQRGPYLIFLRGPAAAPVENLVELGNSVQV